MLTVLDFETTFQVDEKGKKNPSPFLPDNQLVSVGWRMYREARSGGLEFVEDHYTWFHHKDLPFDWDHKEAAARLQEALNKTTLLVAHNAKFELEWLHEAGFTYMGDVWCTMIGEYVFLRGQKRGISLKVACERHGVALKKSDLIDDYMKNNIGFDVIPMPIVVEYGKGDLQSCFELYMAQQKLLQDDEHKGLRETIKLMNEHCLFISDLECNGIHINRKGLEQLIKHYRDEQEVLEVQLKQITSRVMGDRQINLDSPEQLSWLIYSRRVLDKKEWCRVFNIGSEDRNSVRKTKMRTKYSKAKFINLVRLHTVPIRRQIASMCSQCHGEGFVRKTKVDGTPFVNPSKCQKCRGKGIAYENEQGVAGFRYGPSSFWDVSEGGFKTDRTTLLNLAKEGKNALANEFITLYVKYNGNQHIIGTFLEGIERGIGLDDCIHTTFMQCVTATARLSSRAPNFHNLPRGRNFDGSPVLVRGLLTSRFAGGSIMEADWAQLEFRVAVDLAKDVQGKLDIANGVDKHQFTADTLTEAGQETNRQDAKPHTFKPLYGGTSGTSAERKYYREFLLHHPDILQWHEQLQDTAVLSHRITLPSGRQYDFPYARRTSWGGSTFATQIKNYPVQGFATADIVPIGNVEAHRNLTLAKLQPGGLEHSVFINTVHDSLVADVAPGEEEMMIDLVKKSMHAVPEQLRLRYGYIVDVPLTIDIKMGPNWLDLKEVYSG